MSQGVPEQKLRSHLGSLGVTGNLALQPMYTLSGTFRCLEFCNDNILDAGPRMKLELLNFDVL